MREIHQPDGTYHYVFGPNAEPIAHVSIGESVEIHTVDSASNVLTSEDQKPSEVLGPYLNPQTGPLYIDGVEPGDTLVVHVDSMQATRDWAFSALVPGALVVLTQAMWFSVPVLLRLGGVVETSPGPGNPFSAYGFV